MDIKNVTKFIVRTDTIDSFLNDIKGIKPMSVDEEKEAFNNYKNAETKEEKIAIRNEIIMRNIWFIYAVAKRYDANEKEDSKVLEYVNLGVIGMIEAFDNYDVESGNRFCTFSIWYIRRAINGYINGEDMFIVPTNHTRIAPKIKKIEEEFMRKNEGRKPTVEDIEAALLEKYKIKVSDKNDLYGVSIDYIETSANASDEDYTVEDTEDFNDFTSTENLYEDTIYKDGLSHDMSLALKSLTEREKKIINMAYGVGYYKEYTDHEIADELNLTSERVRQIRHKAIDKLKEQYVKIAL
jgi:RNA polymerase primary sigma factor